VPSADAESSTYSARHLSVLEGLEAVRKRPGMYVGSTDSRGLMHCLWEIIDNSVDEALGGHGTDIEVILHEDESVEVRDTARGIPVDIEPKTGLSGVEVVFTKLHAGGKFGSGSYAASGGLHGVGASVVNALSERLDVEVDRDGKTWAMSFHRGEPGIFTDADPSNPRPDAPFAPFISGSDLRVVGKVGKNVTGTRIRYWADPQVFTKGATFQTDELLERARQTAFLVPGLGIRVDDLRGEEPISESFRFAGGIAEVRRLPLDRRAADRHLAHPGHGRVHRDGAVLQENGHMVATELSRECTVDIALRWGTGYDTVFRSFVNIIATPKGGTHQAGFEQGLMKFLRAEVEKNARRLKVSVSSNGGDKLEKEDILAGSHRSADGADRRAAVRGADQGDPRDAGDPQHRGQHGGEGDGRALRQPEARRQGADRAGAREDRRRDEEPHLRPCPKETQRRKNALESSSLPAKLVDCRSNDVLGTELFIVEGDSALGTAKLARDSEFQALLPIRGKILNVQKASVADMLSNAECASIIQVIGAGSGRDFDLSLARYGKVIIMSDADVDGAHIRTLLLTLFYKYMPEMIVKRRVYAAVPPLHRVVVMNPGSKANETIYTYSEQELQGVLAGLKKAGKKYQDPIQRYKGLGEMDADQLAETTMSKAHRTLRCVTMADAEAEIAAAKAFELLMGNDVAPRKDFIIAGQGLDRGRIDT
jgi:DNA gyrase subunit B